MKKILKCAGVITLVIAGVLCTGCTKSKVKEAKEEVHLEAYDGYTCVAKDTKTKYTLHTKDGFALHCAFPSEKNRTGLFSASGGYQSFNQYRIS